MIEKSQAGAWLFFILALF